MKKLMISVLCGLLLTAWIPDNRIFADSVYGWHGFKGNPGHTGFIDQTMDRTLGLQWRYFFGGDYIEPIQVWGDNIYFLDRSGFLSSLKRTDCTLNYKVEVAKSRNIIGIDSSETMIFISSGAAFTRSRGETREITSSLIALELSTGKRVWEVKYPTMMMTAPIVYSDKVYVAIGLMDTNFTKTLGGHLYCLNIPDGSIVFDTEIEEYAFGRISTFISMDESVAVISGMKMDRTSQVQMAPKLFAFDVNKGTPLWTEEPTDENRTFGTPAMQDGYLYVMENPGLRIGGGGGDGPPGGGGGRPPGGGPPGGGPGGGTSKPEAWLLKINAKTGKIEKTMHIENENFGSFSPTLAQDAIYINSFTGKIFCIDYTMEKIYWTKTYNRFSFYTELTATRNYLFTCLYDGMLLCISKEDGSIQYRYKIGNYGGIPVISGREVFVSGEVLYCFSLDAKPLLLTEPSSIDFKILEKGEIKQASFRVLYTGLETLTGTISSEVSWLIPKPNQISGNFQTFFATLDSSKMEDGKHEADLIIETNFGRKVIDITVIIHSPPPLPLTLNLVEPVWITNLNRFTLTGLSEPLVSIFINNLEILADNRGVFRHNLLLHEGDNKLVVIAKSKDKRESSLERTIILDTIPPALEADIHYNIERPEEWIIQGKAEPGTQLILLERTYTPDEDGSFKIVLSLPADITSVVLTCKDKAGNSTINTLKIKS